MLTPSDWHRALVVWILQPLTNKIKKYHHDVQVSNIFNLHDDGLWDTQKSGAEIETTFWNPYYLTDASRGVNGPSPIWWAYLVSLSGAVINQCGINIQISRPQTNPNHSSSRTAKGCSPYRCDRCLARYQLEYTVVVWVVLLLSGHHIRLHFGKSQKMRSSPALPWLWRVETRNYPKNIWEAAALGCWLWISWRLHLIWRLSFYRHWWSDGIWLMGCVDGNDVGAGGQTNPRLLDQQCL